MGLLGGKFPAFRAVKCPRDRHKPPRALTPKRPGRANSLRSAPEQAENRGAAPRQRRLKGALAFERRDELCYHAMPPGDHGLQVIRNLSVPAVPARPAGPARPALPAPLIPPGERLLRADTEPRDRENDPGAGTIGLARQLVAALDAEHRAALEKVRHVRAERARQPVHLPAHEPHTPQRRAREDRRGTVTAAPAETGLHRDAFG